MSYSRWSTSTWYTYWDTASGDTLDTEVFTVCGDGSFTYRQLKDDIEKCLDKCCSSVSDGVKPGEREELMGYMSRFMKDMEKRHEAQ